jgi:hypothetical protein
MSRRWLAFLPLVLTFAVLPAIASAAGHDDPVVTCVQGTQEVTDLTAAVTHLGTVLRAAQPDPTTLSQTAGDLFGAVTAAQTAACLPPLPVSPAGPATQAQDTTKCAADTVRLLSAALGQIAAPPTPTAVLAAATGQATAITAINTDSCLPVKLPVPTVS